MVEKKVYFSLKGSDLEIKIDPPELSKEILSYLLFKKHVIKIGSGIFRARPMHYNVFRRFFYKLGFKIIGIQLNWNLNTKITPLFTLRDYQYEAYRRWEANGYRGVIVIPTGGGKTHVALWAIYKLMKKTLIVVPTLPLVEHWKSNITKYLDVYRIGIFGANQKVLDEITISTYDSAYLNADKFADKFGLVIFDEVHHLPSESYRIIAESLLTEFRMGLTATPERSDMKHTLLDELVGSVVYRIDIETLQNKGHVAKYEIRRIYVPLPSEISEKYNTYKKKYLSFIRSLPDGISPKRKYELMILRSTKDKAAHEALIYYEKARRLALNAEEKLKKLQEILLTHRKEKVIIFTRYTDVVYEISKRFGIPKITSETTQYERETILDSFRKGIYTKLVTAEVLDEGVDVPDASIGIILSGTGSKRQYVQRLGRILRPKDGRAILYELITKGTVDVSISRRRRQKL
ncbi:MAG: DEAD/DEAH box helicase [Candidatus Asgardarchaeia archaeon]